MLFGLNDQHGPVTELQALIPSIDISETVAAARRELENWTGQRFTDPFKLLKVGGVGKIMNKDLHLHP